MAWHASERLYQLTVQLGAHRPAVSHDGEEAPALYLEAINAFKACLQD